MSSTEMEALGGKIGCAIDRLAAIYASDLSHIYDLAKESNLEVTLASVVKYLTKRMKDQTIKFQNGLYLPVKPPRCPKPRKPNPCKRKKPSCPAPASPMPPTKKPCS